MKIYILEYVLEYLIDEKDVRWIIIIVDLISIFILISPCGSTGWHTSVYNGVLNLIAEEQTWQFRDGGGNDELLQFASY